MEHDDTPPIQTLDFLITQSRLKIYEVALILGMSNVTWYTQLENPDAFTVGEVKKLTDAFNKVAQRGQPELSWSDVFQAIAYLRPTFKGPKEL